MSKGRVGSVNYCAFSLSAIGGGSGGKDARSPLCEQGPTRAPGDE